MMIAVSPTNRPHCQGATGIIEREFCRCTNSRKDGKYMPSLVAEIGDAIECHLRMIGLLKNNDLDEHQRKLIEEKRAQYESTVKDAEAKEPSEFPDGAQLCGKCHTKAVIQMDGCMTCLNCGDSKCG